MYALAIRLLYSNLSLKNPPRIEEDNPKTDNIKAFASANSLFCNG